MEDAKLLALYSSLKSSAPVGKSGGLGSRGGASSTHTRIGAGTARPAGDDTLPKNPLYARFVRAGAYDPSQEGISTDFKGTRMKFDEEKPESGGTEPEPSARADSDSDSSAKEKKKRKSKSKSKSKSKVSRDGGSESEAEQPSNSRSKAKAAEGSAAATAAGVKRRRSDSADGDAEASAVATAAKAAEAERKWKLKSRILDLVHQHALSSSKARAKLSKIAKHIAEELRDREPHAFSDHEAAHTAVHDKIRSLLTKGQLVWVKEDKYLAPAGKA